MAECAAPPHAFNYSASRAIMPDMTTQLFRLTAPAIAWSFQTQINNMSYRLHSRPK